MFYPNREGNTVFSLVYSANKTGMARIPLRNLVKFAERWINYSKFYIIPSLLGIALYYIKLNSIEDNNVNSNALTGIPFLTSLKTVDPKSY